MLVEESLIGRTICPAETVAKLVFSENRLALNHETWMKDYVKPELREQYRHEPIVHATTMNA